MRTAAGITINRLVVELGGASVLRDINIDVEKGEVLGILGPSGSGKTTLLRAIAGLVPLRAGQITIGGKDQASVPIWRRDIGFVFQSTNALFPHLTVLENVAFPFRRGEKCLPHVNWNDAVADILAITGLEEYAKRSLSTLSGGQLQRVALARALVYRPSVILLDEPLISLDNNLKWSLIELLVEVKAKVGGTYIYVSHDEREIRYLADRVAILIGGRVAQAGTVEDVWTHPFSPEVARIIGGWNVLTVFNEILTASDMARHDCISGICSAFGIPANKTFFGPIGKVFPPGYCSIKVEVNRCTHTQDGLEFHCQTKIGDRVVAIPLDGTTGVATTGLVAFRKEDAHVF